MLYNASLFLHDRWLSSVSKNVVFSENLLVMLSVMFVHRFVGCSAVGLGLTPTRMSLKIRKPQHLPSRGYPASTNLCGTVTSRGDRPLASAVSLYLISELFSM